MSGHRSRARVARLVQWLALALTLLGPHWAPLGAQVDPTRRWRTLRTAHFIVHFSPGLEPLAQRGAVYAETAWTQLARELHPPRGPVDLVIADNLDVTNGFATIFPTNRIVIYAQPPVAMRELRFYEDWAQLVITHELLHIFHLDRARGVWRLGQAVLGRHPALFPNAYLPSWVKEGLAVHYETRLTGAGRLASTEFPMIARTAALANRMPSSRDWSLATTDFPLGNATYAYGAMVIDHLLRTSADSQAARRFVERTAVWPIPFMVEPAARAAFGRSVPAGVRDWQARVRAAAQRPWRDTARWTPRTAPTWGMEYPRWQDDSTLLVAMQPAQQMPGLYAVSVSGEGEAGAAPRRLSRRNSLDATVPLADGTRLFAQLEQDGPFALRSDLWREGPGGTRRLTRGARLSHPDVPAGDRAANARIVAVQSIDGTTRLVRVSPDGRAVRALTVAHPDTQWAEPRWRRDGRALVALQLVRGGYSRLVLLDSTGARLGSVGPVRAVLAAPVWSDQDELWFTDDRSGSAQLARVSLPLAACRAEAPCEVPISDPRVVRATELPTGVFQPSPSPDGRVAALAFARDGLRLVLGTSAAPIASGDTSSVYAPVAQSGAAPDSAPRPTTAYSPWRQLWPRYWTPVLGQSALYGPTVGVASSGSDIVGQHSWSALVAVPVERADIEGAVAWRYRGFGQPVLDLGATQGWDYFDVLSRVPRVPGSSDSVLVRSGRLRRVSRIASLGLTLVRPGLRQGGALSLGASLEQRDFSTDPPARLAALPAIFRTQPLYPAFTLSGSWSTVQRPGRSISLEDGVTITGSAQRRWRTDAPATTGSTRLVGTLRGYKSLPLPGFARHALAVRLAGAWNDRRASSDVSVGGASGSQVELLPGTVVGDPARTFAVRGFAPGAQRGISAAAGSIEYRAPLRAVARGIGRFPLFLDRTALSLFADAGRAWCPVGDVSVVCAGQRAQDQWLSSVGAELSLLSAFAYDAPYRVRVGVAQPLSAATGVRTRTSAYVTFGLSF